MTTEKKAKVNKRQSRRRRWFEGGLADSEGGCLSGGSRLQKGRVDTSAASWRHADFRHTEHTGLRRGAWAPAVWQEATTNDCGEDRGPRGPPPPPRLQRHPHRGRRKCIWGRAPGGAPRPFRVETPTGSGLGVQPLSAHRHPVPGALGLGGPRPLCLPRFPAFRADRQPLPASGSGPARPEGPRAQRAPALQPARAAREAAPPRCSRKPPAGGGKGGG